MSKPIFVECSDKGPVFGTCFFEEPNPHIKRGHQSLPYIPAPSEREKNILQLARSLIRDAAFDWARDELAANPEEVCLSLSEMLGERYDFEKGEVVGIDSKKEDLRKRLLWEINDAEVILKSNAEWEYKYDRIFGIVGYIRELVSELGLSMKYCDPDSSYEEDVRAYIGALREVKSKLISEANRERVAEAQKAYDEAKAKLEAEGIEGF
jgi:hypothetical protein